mmetsp:Transcript_9290/g.15641  ORF Transcript_9290/g.15641 Transcript_9290/m.15641 type:complete len:143 (+) Transcript_9290:939-1367(+)
MVKSIPQTLPPQIQGSENESSKVVDISQLQMGENPDFVLSAKIVNNLEKQTDVPMSFLMVDYKHNFCVGSVYHTNKSIETKLKSGNEIIIKNPHLVLVTLTFKGYTYNYQCVKVTNAKNIMVNGVSLKQESAHSETISKTFT